jgi:hypothetical protein
MVLNWLGTAESSYILKGSRCTVQYTVSEGMQANNMETETKSAIHRQISIDNDGMRREAEFLEVIGTKGFRVFLLAPLLTDFTPPPPPPGGGVKFFLKKKKKKRKSKIEPKKKKKKKKKKTNKKHTQIFFFFFQLKTK